MTTPQVRALAAAVLLALATGPAIADSRSGPLQERHEEEAAAECRSDPDCMKAVRKAEARKRLEDARQREAMGALPWYERAFRIVGGLAALAAMASVPLWIAFRVMGG